MELSLLLMRKILTMGIMVLIGYAATKKKLLSDKDADTCSILCLYIIYPCNMISAFASTEYSHGKAVNLVLCILTAFAMHIVFVLLTGAIGLAVNRRGSGRDRFDRIMQGSVVYTNCGNLLLPIIGSLVGGDGVFYATAYIMMQTIFTWTHGAVLIGGWDKISPKKLLNNPNMIAIALGLIIYFFRIPFPDIATESLSIISSAIGPVSMIMTGIVMACTDLKAVFTNISVYLTVLLRLFVYPFVCVLIMFFVSRLGIGLDSELAGTLVVPFLAAAAPAAASVTQLAKLFDEDYIFAGAINVMSMILCVISMPVMIYIYQMMLM